MWSYFFFASVRSSGGNIDWLLLKSAHLLDNIAQSLHRFYGALTSDVDGLKFLPNLWWNAGEK